MEFGLILLTAVGIYFFVAMNLFLIAASWVCFVKAEEPGWAILIPFYSIHVMHRIIGKEWWWLLLWFVPFVGQIIPIYVLIVFAQSFDKGILFGIGLVVLPFIFLPILAFGESEYVGAP